jgi:hypothetical protein
MHNYKQQQASELTLRPYNINDISVIGQCYKLFTTVTYAHNMERYNGHNMQASVITFLNEKIIIVKNTTAYTWGWYCHLVVDRASLV